MEDSTRDMPQGGIQCQRGFMSRDQIEKYIANGDGNECNGCSNFCYAAGIGGCKYTQTVYHQ